MPIPLTAVPASRHLARLAERGAEELAVALGSIADAARSGTGLSVALVCRVDGDQCQLMAVSTDAAIPLNTGDSVPLDQMLDELVVSGDGPVALPDARAADPRSAALGLGSYAGVPLRRLNGDLYGTLAVLDPDPKDNLDGEVEFLERLSRLVTHEIGLQDALQRLLDEVGEGSTAEGKDVDPVADLHGLAAVIEGILRQTGPHDRDRLERTVAKETSRFAHDLMDTLMRHRTVAVLPGNLEPWGTEVDELLERGANLLPGNQGDRIRVNATSGATADIPRRHLERILVNLVYRAWRTAPPPTPITIASRLRPGAVEISVDDEGDAVPPSEAEAMFDQDGRGLLGLSVVKELAMRAGGTVRYERRDESNRIVVRLPLAGVPRAVVDDNTPMPASMGNGD